MRSGFSRWARTKRWVLLSAESMRCPMISRLDHFSLPLVCRLSISEMARSRGTMSRTTARRSSDTSLMVPSPPGGRASDCRQLQSIRRNVGGARAGLGAEAGAVDAVLAHLVADDPLGGVEQPRRSSPAAARNLERVEDQVLLVALHR